MTDAAAAPGFMDVFLDHVSNVSDFIWGAAWIWRMGDISSAAMALPNRIAILAPSGVVFAIARGNPTAARDEVSGPGLRTVEEKE